jgi:uncharacterized membrane protein
MKKQDLALIVVVVVISVALALFISKATVASPQKRQQQVEVVQPISASMAKPDSRYFNNQAIDPTKLITIGTNANPDPFSGSSTAQQ